VKPLPTIVILGGVILGGLAIVIGAPPYISEPVRVLLGLGYGAALVAILRGPLGKAIANQLQGGAAVPVEQILTQLDEVSTDLQALRDDLALLHERMDFAERVLVRERGGERLGEGKA
jgi:hypothetical protein